MQMGVKCGTPFQPLVYVMPCKTSASTHGWHRVHRQSREGWLQVPEPLPGQQQAGEEEAMYILLFDFLC